jgi:pilus assembly protein CpaB
MRNIRGVLMILVSMCLASVAVFFAWQYVGSKTQVETNSVAVATRDIDLGTRLTPDMVQMVKWPRESMPDGAFNAVAALLKDPQSQEPRVARVGIQRGEPVLESRLAPTGSKAGLSAVISPGKRAMTVRVNDVVGVAGFALPGSFVDVLVNTMVRDTSPRAVAQPETSITKTVLDRILVLAIAQEVGRDETKPKVVNAVTLEVTPEEAERLDLARSVGTLSLVLRNQIDASSTPSDGITKQQLLGLVESGPVSATPAPVAVRHRPAVARPLVAQTRVEVIRGNVRNNQDF